MPYYFAYGANMSPEVFSRRVGKAPCLGVAYLENYRLIFPRYSVKKQVEKEARYHGAISDNGLASSVQPSKGFRVYGILYELTEDQFDKLDVFENVGKGAYGRQETRAQLLDGISYDCTIYSYISNKIELGAYSPSYLDNIIELGTMHDFPGEYLEEIKRMRSAVFRTSIVEAEHHGPVVILNAKALQQRGLREQDMVLVLHQQEYVLARVFVGNMSNSCCGLNAYASEKLDCREEEHITVLKLI